MARYDFKCTMCNDVFETSHPAGSYRCKKCDGIAFRIFSPPAIHFKYTTGNPPPADIRREMQDYGIDTDKEYGVD